MATDVRVIQRTTIRDGWGSHSKPDDEPLEAMSVYSRLGRIAISVGGIEFLVDHDELQRALQKALLKCLSYGPLQETES